MKCKKCNQAVPEDSDFCPYCGAPIEKEKTCPECGHAIPEESSFCPFCGYKLQSDNHETKAELKAEKKSRKQRAPKKSILRTAIIALVTIVILLGGYFGLNTVFAKMYLASEEYSKAMACFDRIIIASKVFPGEYVLAKAGKSFVDGDTNSFVFLAKINALSKHHSGLVSKELKNRITEDVYNSAVNWYELGRYGATKFDENTAFQYFDAVDPYKDSSNYLILLRARSTSPLSYSGKEEKDLVLDIIDFKDAKDVLVSNDTIAWEFLEGKWKTSDSGYYFNISTDGDHYSMSYNIPADEIEDSYLGIINGNVFLYNMDLEDAMTAYRQGNYSRLFTITVDDAQQIAIYSYKSDSEYLLFRE